MTTGLVNKIIRFSAVDGPGNRTAIFLQGCNFRCTYCHNPETIHLCTNCGVCAAACPAQALRMEDGAVRWDAARCVGCDRCIHVCPACSSPKTRRMTPREVLNEIGSARSFIRGITVSGGEATQQRDFLCELFELAGPEGLSRFLDSNGSLDFSRDARLLACTDKVMLDIKAFGAAEHRAVTGQDNGVVLENLSFLCAQNKLYEVRSVIVPGLYDAEDTVDRVSEILRAYPEVRYKLIRYRPFGVRAPYREQYAVPGEAQMRALAARLHANGVENTIIT